MKRIHNKNESFHTLKMKILKSFGVHQDICKNIISMERVIPSEFFKRKKEGVQKILP